MAVQLVSVALEGDKFDFCATDIHANTKGMVFWKGRHVIPF